MTTDRGEQIIRLAGALLKDGKYKNATSFRHARKTPSFRPTASACLLCLTAALSSIGACLLTQHAINPFRPANRYERVEIEALFFYAEQTRGLSQVILRKEIRSQLAIKTSWHNLSMQDYERVREVLQDILVP